MSKDDPMDLGPFLQEYVLRNPFESPGAGKRSPPAVPSGVSPKLKGKGHVHYLLGPTEGRAGVGKKSPSLGSDHYLRDTGAG